MISWKALIIGLIVTLIVGLIGQGLYILLAAYIGMSSGDSVFLSTYRKELWFAFAMFVFCLIMAFGGMLTGTIAAHYKVSHAAVVGFLASIASIMPALENASMTPMAAVMVLLGTVLAILGGLYARRGSNMNKANTEVEV